MEASRERRATVGVENRAEIAMIPDPRALCNVLIAHARAIDACPPDSHAKREHIMADAEQTVAHWLKPLNARFAELEAQNLRWQQTVDSLNRQIQTAFKAPS